MGRLLAVQSSEPVRDPIGSSAEKCLGFPKCRPWKLLMLESIRSLYLDSESLLAQAQLIFFMLGMGATLTWRDFSLVFRRPRALTLGLTSVLLLSPLFAYGIAEVAEPSEGITVGLVLLAAMPGGSMSNFMTYLARGNVALSIALSACGALAALVTVPIVLQLFSRAFADLVMPTEVIIREIALCMLLPLTLGMAVARWRPVWAASTSWWSIRIALLLVVCMVLGSFASNRIELGRYSLTTLGLFVVFGILLQQVSMLPYRIAGWLHRDVVAIGIEATVRNVYLGLLLAVTIFPAGAKNAALGGDVFFVLLFYGGASLVLSLPLAWRFRRVIRKLEARAALNTPSEPVG